MPYKVSAGGQVRGLAESVATFKGLGPVVSAAHAVELTKIGKETKSGARSAYQARQGGTREQRQPESIGFDAQHDKFIVFIERDGTSPAAEFGAKTHQVYGRRVSQRSMKARTAGGWSRKGKLVGPLLEPYRVRRHSRRVADRGLKAISKSLSAHGVPR